MQQEDDGADGPATVSIAPTDHVYSYFMFMSPIEEKKKESGGGFSWGILLAYTLVLCTFALQGVMLYAIFEQVVMGDTVWRAGIVNEKLKPGMCNPGGSLCVKKNNTFTCAPPTVQLTGRWNELDTDGDGIWTYDEVKAAKDDLQCKYVVNPLEVFNVFVTFLVSREKIIWVHPELKAGKKIHKAYFTYAAGDIIMCGYRNQDMCANVLERGYFDGPLKYNTAPRVGNTIRSALDYCHALLEDGGMCERTLPSTYAVWRKTGASQCRGPQYSKMVYKHPVTGITKSMLKVDYVARQDYKRANSSALHHVQGLHHWHLSLGDVCGAEGHPPGRGVARELPVRLGRGGGRGGEGGARRRNW